MGTPIDYQMPLTPPARPPRNVWFGAASALSAGLAWLLLMIGPPFPEWLLNGVVAVFCILALIAGIVGLKRGAASMILSILALIMALLMTLVWFMVATSSGS